MTSHSPARSKSTPISVADPFAHSEVSRALIDSLPAKADLDILLGKVSKVSLFCYQSNYKSRIATGGELPREAISISSLTYPESHPVLLARQMLLFAAALQYLSPNEVIPGVSKHHHTIMEELAESAIKLVTTNHLLLGTLESLENIILEAFYHIDSGNIRRAWMTLRHGVMVAQLLGLHRPGHYRFKIINDQNNLDPQVMWACVVSMERFLSLLLDLPTSTSGISFVTPEATSASVQDNSLPALTMDVTAKILERNQLQDPHQALDMTREIDRELVKLTDRMPSTFWRPPTFAGMQADSVDAFWELRRTWDQMCYYTLVNQLHLPFMLSTGHGQQLVVSRMACVNASRQVLTRMVIIRTFNPITACCRKGDFMALIAGMTLMLAYIISRCNPEMNNLLIHQRLGDRAIVEQALECMKAMSELRKDVLAAKCAAMLKDLLAIEAAIARGEDVYARGVQILESGLEMDHNVLIVKVPYIGAVRVARDGISTITLAELQQNRDMYEGADVGGIGSIQVNNSKPPNNYDSTAISNAVSTHGIDGFQPMPRDVAVQHADMYPDIAADLDDWVFQGFDTAFFETLIRGSEQQSRDAGAEGWDFTTFT
ncbi:hypothetical protein NA57DRAFT_32325 [Rhizodiscina lignyota]|uniref:Xylanolytic transcriptional activator regulatory domain-containing protein n=1 Tax=Rhizodiscina lignyota TaxID=1504668 RepID=A0A9P4IKY3_9PEZI|nr:hypothetical protein NA57DRAFT_32325 [Rhizodiscina lignyota]